MRKDDPGYVNWQKYPRCQPYLDGVELKDCVTADEEKGEVIVFRRNKDGNLELTAAKDEIITEKLYGDVRIDLEPDTTGGAVD